MRGHFATDVGRRNASDYGPVAGENPTSRPQQSVPPALASVETHRHNQAAVGSAHTDPIAGAQATPHKTMPERPFFSGKKAQKAQARRRGAVWLRAASLGEHGRHKLGAAKQRKVLFQGLGAPHKVRIAWPAAQGWAQLSTPGCAGQECLCCQPHCRKARRSSGVDMCGFT